MEGFAGRLSGDVPVSSGVMGEQTEQTDKQTFRQTLRQVNIEELQKFLPDDCLEMCQCLLECWGNRRD